MAPTALPYFVALPEAAPPWPGVVVIHEGPGISPQLLRVCERLAAEGYAAVAPDLFFRAGGTQAKPFTELIGSLDHAQVLDDVRTAIDRVRALGADRVGITGFCMGGGITHRAAVDGLDVDCAAAFYGARIGSELGEPACPLLVLYGGTDEYIPPEEIAAVTAHYGDERVVVYPEAGHGFMRDGSDSYDEAAATDAWRRLLAFFEQHLRR